MSAYLLLLLAVLAAAAQNSLVRLFNQQYGSTDRPYYLFNAVGYGVVALVSWLLSLGALWFPWQTVLFGMGYGVLFFLTLLLYRKALLNGPVGVCSMLLSFSILLTIAYTSLRMGEPLRLNDVGGLLAFIVSVCLTCLRGGHAATPQSWYLCSIGMMLTNAAATILTKEHQSLMGESHTKAYLLVGFLTASLLSLSVWFLSRKQEESPKPSGRFYRLAIVTGLAVFGSAYCTTLLMNRLPAAVLFPTLSAGGVFVTALAGLLLFRELLTIREWFGLLVGLIGIVWLNL